MNKKKILYITPALPVGGAERFLLSLSGALIPDTDKQWIISLSNINVLAPEIAPGIEFIALPRKSKFDLKPVKEIRRLIKTEQPDIVFCINFFSYFVLRCALFGIRYKPRIIISYHSTEHVSRKEHWLHHLYARLLTKRDEIVAVSQRQADYTIRTYRIPRSKFDVVLNCVDTDYWKPDTTGSVRSRVRQQLGIPEDAPVIILTAAFRPEKNHAGGIRALKLLHEKYNCRAYLLFVGDGVLRPAIEAAVLNSGISSYIKLAGLQKDVRPFYQAADIFTLVSSRVETFSIAALEAMSCGLTEVLTDVGGAAEMVSPGINGFLCVAEDDSIAQNWLKGLNSDFRKEDIHAYAYTHFRKEKMVLSYKKIFELAS
ncbi:MAG: glycosyltransferase [Chitinophagaceae bacterium]|nr:glycosyltransferase [Chitinophagaceae bacterium]